MTYKIISAVLILLISACTNITPVDQQFSGYLKDYSGLEAVHMDDGTRAMRWWSPSLTDRSYSKAIVRPIEYYPEPKTSDQVSLDRLSAISEYMTERLRTELGKEFELVSQPGPDTAEFQFAITGVETPTEGLHAYNAIPVSMLIAGAAVATGERDHVVVLYLEGQLTDSESGEVLAKGVRQGNGDKLENDKEQLELEHLTDLIDSWAVEIGSLGTRLKG